MFTVAIDGYAELLRELDRIDTTLKRRLTRECVSAAAAVLVARAKALCPVGDPGDNPELKPLSDTIGIVVREYGDERTLALIGPEVPAGAHGHNVEYGHAEVVFGRRTGRRVPPNPFMRRAFDETLSAQQAAMEQVAAAAIRDLGIQGA